jgi:hypothetical protein
MIGRADRQSNEITHFNPAGPAMRDLLSTPLALDLRFKTTGKSIFLEKNICHRHVVHYFYSS